MIDLNTPAGAALITGFFVVLASAVVPWVREWTSERRRKREELARLVRLEVHGALRALAHAPVARARMRSADGPAHLDEQAARESEHVFALALLVPGEGVVLSNMLLMAFSIARDDDEAAALRAIGSASRALVSWYSGEANIDEAWEYFAAGAGLPADMELATDVMLNRLDVEDPFKPGDPTQK